MVREKLLVAIFGNTKTEPNNKWALDSEVRLFAKSYIAKSQNVRLYIGNE
jgi:hypothetical protein